MILIILLILVVIAAIPSVSVFIGKKMKSGMSGLKNGILGFVAFFVPGIIVFFGQVMYYKLFLTERERYWLLHSGDGDKLMSRVFVIALLVAIVSWLVVTYRVNKKK